MPLWGIWVAEALYYPMGWSIAMGNREEKRTYSVEEEQALAQEAQQRGMTVEDLKNQRERERKDVTSQGTEQTNN